MESFLTLFCKADKNIEVDAGGNLPRARVWPAFQQYASKPGEAVQTLRQFPRLLRSGAVPAIAVRAARTRFRRVPAGTLPCLYNFLATCFDLHAAMLPGHLGKTKRFVYSAN